MRITVYQKALMGFLSLSIFLLVVTTGFLPLTVGQDEPILIIDLYNSNDWNQHIEGIIFEGRTYDVVVSSENESVILDVNITMLETTYVTSLTEPYITINAPSFNESDSFVIIATKEGYQDATLELAVLKGELLVSTDRVVVEEKKEFEVAVTDQDGNPVEGAFVFVTEDASPLLTNMDGKAVVRAPEIDIFSTAAIQVIKSGYLPGSTTIRIEPVTGSLFEITEAQFLQILPILLALLVVIFSVIYVLVKQNRNQKTPGRNKPGTSSGEPHLPQPEKIHGTNNQARFSEKEKNKLTSTTSDSRVEEIRIPVQAKKKETTFLSDEKGDTQPSENEKLREDEWFKGQDYLRYKLDELTGKIDQQTDGKWFEGQHDTKHKVDETLKKNVKKKKSEEGIDN